MKGTLYKDKNTWWVKHTYGDVRLAPDEVTDKLQEGQEIMFLYEKKFLASETLWFAKSIPPHPTWESILKHYIEENENHGVDASDFYDWLKENYHPPKNK
jgi:hypothetical protein